jgi:hypothetical protein
LAESIQQGELTEYQAVSVVENAFFHVANKLYNLNLRPEHQTILPVSHNPISSNTASDTHVIERKSVNAISYEAPTVNS